MSEDLVTIRTTKRRADALERIIDMQLACEESGMLTPTPPALSAEERDEAMHGTRRPIQDGDEVLYPIACRRNELAHQRGEDLGGCRWVADDRIGDGVACTACGKAEGPGMQRCKKLRSMVDGTYAPGVESGRFYEVLEREVIGDVERVKVRLKGKIESVVLTEDIGLAEAAVDRMIEDGPDHPSVRLVTETDDEYRARLAAIYGRSKKRPASSR